MTLIPAAVYMAAVVIMVLCIELKPPVPPPEKTIKL